MEHKLDDFFRKKIDSTEDSLPENFTFDEQLFWDTLQKNLDKPQSKAWWKWVVAAACIGGLAMWVVFTYKASPKVPITHEVKKEEHIRQEVSPVAVATAIPEKAKVHLAKKKIIVEPEKDLKMPVEHLAIKTNPLSIPAPAIKQDSIHFKPIIVAETQPQFKTIHVNEISNTEKSPLPQPKFKIRFAARNQH